MWSSPIKEYYSAKKRNEALIYTATWMNLENKLKERRQMRTVWSHLYAMSKIGKSIERESGFVVAKERGGGEIPTGCL